MFEAIRWLDSFEKAHDEFRVRTKSGAIGGIKIPLDNILLFVLNFKLFICSFNRCCNDNDHSILLRA